MRMAGTTGERHIPQLAILASGNGSTAEAVIRATTDGRLAAQVGLVVCNNPQGKAFIHERVRTMNLRHGLDIELAVINGRSHPEGRIDRGQTLAESAAICQRLGKAGVTHVALLGYMKRVRGDLLDSYGWRHGLGLYQSRMTNTHPGPLPETAGVYGLAAARTVLNLGLAESAHSLQLVADDIDEGPLVAVNPVEVLPGDTAEDLFERTRVVEKAALPYALDRFLSEQTAWADEMSRLPPG